MNEIIKRAEFAPLRGKKVCVQQGAHHPALVVIRPLVIAESRSQRIATMVRENLRDFGISLTVEYSRHAFSVCYDILDGLTDGSKNSPGAR